MIYSPATTVAGGFLFFGGRNIPQTQRSFPRRGPKCAKIEARVATQILAREA